MAQSTLWQQILTAPGDENLKSRYIQALKRAGDRKAEIFRLAAELQKFPPYYVQHEALARQYESSLEDWRTFRTHAHRPRLRLSSLWHCRSFP